MEKHRKLLKLLSVTGAVYLFLRYISPLVAPVLVALLFVTICGPLLQKLRLRFHIPRRLGAILLLLLLVATLGSGTWLLFRGAWGTWGALLPHRLADVLEGITGTDISRFGHILSGWKEGLGRVASLMGFAVTFLISTVLLAGDYDDLMNRMLEREEFHMVLSVLVGIVRYLATYVKAQLVIMGLISTVSGAVLWLAGIPGGGLFGVAAGFLDALPFVGTGVVLGPVAIMQFYENYPGRGVVCILLYAVCVLARQLLEPKLIGRRMGLPPIAVLLSLYVGIRLFGVWGILKGPLGLVIIRQVVASDFYVKTR